MLLLDFKVHTDKQLQTQIDVAAWRQQMVADREKDVQLLTHKLEGIMDRGGDIIHIMEIQRESPVLDLADEQGSNNRRRLLLYKDELTR
jgi:hypothetical protein